MGHLLKQSLPGVYSCHVRICSNIYVGKRLLASCISCPLTGSQNKCEASKRTISNFSAMSQRLLVIRGCSAQVPRTQGLVHQAYLCLSLSAALRARRHAFRSRAHHVHCYQAATFRKPMLRRDCAEYQGGLQQRRL
jgi:hypothetical protein